MQMYQGLPIITNKITPEEQRGIPHHLLGIIGLQEETWTVGVFKRRAQSIIREIQARGKLPILVGGTHYYTQSLLFKEKLVDDNTNTASTHDYLPREQLIQKYPILDAPTADILEQLTLVDPVMASRWHPNDRRRILRSLEIYLTTGRKASDIYREQRAKKLNTQSEDAGDRNDDSILQSALLIWVHAEPEVLRPRLDSRVDDMISRGLLDEVKSLELYSQQQALQAQLPDKTRGIWVSIGYKEFQSFLTLLRDDLSAEDDRETALRKAVEKTKVATKQYAKSQVHWIRVKLLAALTDESELERFYILDGSDVHAWQANVSEPAIDLVNRFLMGDDLPNPVQHSDIAGTLLSPKQDHDHGQRPDLWIREVCDLCHMTAVTHREWEAHLKSRSHRRNLRKKERNELNPRFLTRTREVSDPPAENAPE